MIRKLFICAVLCITSLNINGQNSINVRANIDVDAKTITINQDIVYKNTSRDTLHTIFLNDWNNSYATKSTPLAKRFEEEFSTKFHLAKDEQRGYTTIEHIKDNANNILEYSYLKAHPDVIEVTLKRPLLPNESYNIELSYSLVTPDDTFTSYGVTKSKDFNLQHWYITPAVYDGKWHYYSNKNLNDLYNPKSDVTLTLTHPRNYTIVSELDIVGLEPNGNTQTSTLFGKDRIDTFISITKLPVYSFIQTDDFTLISDIGTKGLAPPEKAMLTDKITRYLTENIGPYPHKRLLVSDLEYRRNPLYGLNQLPDFLRPFPDSFQYELKLLKTALKKYIDNVLLINPRKEHWLSEGLQIYFLMKYVETYYPDMKFLGTLANVWGIRAFHAADVDFNFQYVLFFMEMARKNRDQPLTTSKDSLIKFNANIAGKYKAGIGLNYLDDFADDINLQKRITTFIKDNTLKPTSTAAFETYIKQQTSKNINWFFEDYLNTRKKIDFKIKDVEVTEDSITLTIKNKRKNKMPVSLFSLNNDSILSKIWIEDIKDEKVITIPKDSTNKLVLNYDTTIPEFNQRDNWKSLKGFFFNNKPLQFRLFKDIEDPYYNQVFLMPLAEFKNIYDGFTLGAKVYNKTLLRKRLNYKLSPQYAFNSKSLTGSASVFYTHNIENSNLFDITYGISAAYRSFAEDAFFTRIRPSLTFSFRDDDDFRSDRIDQLNLRYVSIKRNIGPDAIIEELDEEPDYGVFNIRYSHSNPGIINYSRYFSDFQVADKFGKIAFNYEFRRLTKNNRNINIRFYGGLFLWNNTDPNSNFFSFALDRPTDYLFDFNYLGRSEASGIFSQQIIIAEGGFKSQLDIDPELPAFANQWITTANFSTSIWRYIQAYGDIGLVKNKYQSPKFVYDSGIRLVLVEDYFEIFFPVYSNLGWEIAQENYDQKIRFMFTVDPQVLLGLFRRKWY